MENIQVTLFLRASLVRPVLAFGSVGFSDSKTAPVCVQNAQVEVISSRAEPATWFVCQKGSFLSTASREKGEE